MRGSVRIERRSSTEGPLEAEVGMTTQRPVGSHLTKALAIGLTVALVAGTLPLAIWSPVYRLGAVKAATRGTEPGVAPGGSPNGARAVGVQGILPGLGRLRGAGALTALGQADGMLPHVTSTCWPRQQSSARTHSACWSTSLYWATSRPGARSAGRAPFPCRGLATRAATAGVADKWSPRHP